MFYRLNRRIFERGGMKTLFSVKGNALFARLSPRDPMTRHPFIVASICHIYRHCSESTAFHSYCGIKRLTKKNAWRAFCYLCIQSSEHLTRSRLPCNAFHNYRLFQ